MPWHIGTSDECPAETPVAVIKDDDGSVAGCHANEADAQAQIAALYAEEPGAASMAHIENNPALCGPDAPWAVVNDETGEADGCYATEEEANAALGEQPAPEVQTVGNRFDALLAVEGHETGDGRMFELDSITWRDLPVPLMLQSDTGPGGHVGAWYAGAIEEVMRDPVEPSRILASGHFAGPRAAEAEEYVRAGLRGVSVDVSGSDVVVEGFDPDSEGYPTRYLERYGDARIMGATITPFAAFEETQVWLPDEMEAPPVTQEVAGQEIPHGEEQEPLLMMWGERRRRGAGLTAACGDCQPGYRPPARFFADLRLDGPTPWTVADDGEIYGHIATWGTCHVGVPGRCEEPPRSVTGYAYFHLGEVICDDGSRVSVGNVSMTIDPKSEGHMNDLYASMPQALAHYDNTGLVVADLRAGEDRYGIWVHGALRHGLPESRVAALRASKPSGDWRPVNGNGELCHVLATNSPGFPVLRARVASSGQVLAMVAAVAPHQQTDHDRISALEREVSSLRSIIRAEALRRLDARARVRQVTEFDRRVNTGR